MNKDVWDLLAELEEIIESSKGVFLSPGSVAVNKKDLLEIITEIRIKLPDEVKKSKGIYSQKDTILGNAQKEADYILEEARERATRLVDEDDITRSAEERSREIMEHARMQAAEMRESSLEYTSSLLSKAQDDLQKLIEIIEDNKNELE